VEDNLDSHSHAITTKVVAWCFAGRQPICSLPIHAVEEVLQVALQREVESL
jgi:hypothetical protein